MQTLFSYNAGALSTLDEADKDIKYTFTRIYDLYHYILLLLVELGDYANSKIEKAKKKYLPTEQDLSPNKKFVNNKILVQLRKNKYLYRYIQKRKYTWKKNNELLKDLYEEFTKTQEYENYMNGDDNSYEADKNILLFLIENVFYNSKNLYSTLEEESIYWIDNVDIVLLAIVITMERFRIHDNENKKLLRKFKNRDDQKYAYKLLHLPIIKKDTYTEIIKDNVINWDFDRIAKLDKIILTMAIAELMDFPEIPVKVSLNEYIELSKAYGIPNKSSNFVNGLLDKIVSDLNRKEMIQKRGRGLKNH